MKKQLVLFSSVLLMFLVFSCKSGNNNASAAADSSGEKPIVINPANNIPEFRKEVKKEPVDEYSEKTDNPINNWYFSVKLYETPLTFHYLIKMQFEELTGEDTLKLPNFGTIPKR